MLFNSIAFWLFFAVVGLLYFILPHRWQNRMLLVASYVFYGAWDWRFLSLIVLSTGVDYAASKAIYATDDAARRKRWITLSLVSNFGLLAVFKYYDFFVVSLQDLLSVIGLSASIRLLEVAVPVGISFYTFQTVSYTIDVFRGKMKPSQSIEEFALYVAFFPQLVAGPIERATELLDQIRVPRRVTKDGVSSGIYLCVWGLLKKTVIADNLSLSVDRLFAPGYQHDAGSVVMAAAYFAIQIYCDFSGYTDIARGVSRILGFELRLNFNIPYIATSPQDFWHRWHISLSTWLRDYLYIPLGGSRKGVARTYINLMITMVLGGLWHGAAWNYVLWGAYHGALLSLHRVIALRWPGKTAEGRGARLLSHTWKALVMTVFTLYGWLLFRAGSLEQVVDMTGALSHGFPIRRFVIDGVRLMFYAWPLVLMQIAQAWSGDLFIVRRLPGWAQALFYVVCIYLIAILGAFESNAFIYFQF